MIQSSMENAVRKAILSTTTHHNKGAQAIYPQDIALSEDGAVEIKRNLPGDGDFAAGDWRTFNFERYGPLSFWRRTVAAIKPCKGLRLVACDFYHLATAYHCHRRTSPRLYRAEPWRVFDVDANGLGPVGLHPDIEG